MMGWLAVLSCAPLWNPPLWAVLALRMLAARAAPFQLVAAAFVQALRLATRARAIGVAQSGPCAVQGLGVLAGVLAQAIGAPVAVGLAGLVGLTAATMLAMTWTHLRVRLIEAQRQRRRPQTPRRTL